MSQSPFLTASGDCNQVTWTDVVDSEGDGNKGRQQVCLLRLGVRVFLQTPGRVWISSIKRHASSTSRIFEESILMVKGFISITAPGVSSQSGSEEPETKITLRPGREARRVAANSGPANPGMATSVIRTSIGPVFRLESDSASLP